MSHCGWKLYNTAEAAGFATAEFGHLAMHAATSVAAAVLETVLQQQQLPQLSHESPLSLQLHCCNSLQAGDAVNAGAVV
jgi:hypothetical protein